MTCPRRVDRLDYGRSSGSALTPFIVLVSGSDNYTALAINPTPLSDDICVGRVRVTKRFANAASLSIAIMAVQLF